MVAFEPTWPDSRFTPWEGAFKEGCAEVEPAVRGCFLDTLTAMWTAAFMITAGGTEYSREMPLTFLSRLGMKHLDVANALPAAVDGWRYIVVLLSVDEEGAAAPECPTLTWNAEDTDNLGASRAVSLLREAGRPVPLAKEPSSNQRADGVGCCVYFKLEPDPIARAVMTLHLRRGTSGTPPPAKGK